MFSYANLNEGRKRRGWQTWFVMQLRKKRPQQVEIISWMSESHSDRRNARHLLG